MHQTGTHDLLPRLQRWYLSQCDGDWEHSWGVKIGTLDNPGWSLEVDLKSTDLEGRTFHPRTRGLGGSEPSADWLSISIEDCTFKGFGGPESLVELIETFLSWAETP